MPNSLAPYTCLALVLCICWTASSSDLVDHAFLRNRIHKPSNTHGHEEHRFLNSSSASGASLASGSHVLKADVSSAKQVDREPQNSPSLAGSAGPNENRGPDFFSGDSLKGEPRTRIHIPTRLEAWRSAVPEGGRSAKCHPLCNAHGTCNEDLGRCDCPNNRSGADCSVIKTPACEVQPGYTTPCHSLLGSVPTCECAAQCDFQGTIVEELPSCLARVDALSPERRDKALTATIHSIDGVDRVEVEYLSKGRGVSTPIESALGEVRERLLTKQQLLPLDRCPGSCSFAGICERMLDREETRCKCHEDRQGASCEFAVTNFCVNQCSGRGRCSQGRTPTAAAAEKDTSPPRIYVYDMPHEWTTGIIRHTRADTSYCIHRNYDRNGRAHGSGNAYQTQVWLHERLLRSEHRTFDGAQADFYFIPFWHLCQKKRFNQGDLLLLHLNYVQMTWPYWYVTLCTLFMSRRRGLTRMSHAAPYLCPDDVAPRYVTLCTSSVSRRHNNTLWED
ncbi:hypothetical protein CYMTET_13237 [Cymbomonas tetramitiformis]|uniref:EGF-like domain-containing protein n=1 Tax=Cymbomonas tetramitiformis TaxID=36881 RepID=A0AAE0LBL7_9CHLO|nr:hypothetical protein CYMTET_13237 [Cymbomonas tetramitiformis]